MNPCTATNPCRACVGRPADPYRGERYEKPLRGFEHHPPTCAVHRGYPTAWGHGCDCGLLEAVRAAQTEGAR